MLQYVKEIKLLDHLMEYHSIEIDPKTQNEIRNYQHLIQINREIELLYKFNFI